MLLRDRDDLVLAASCLKAAFARHDQLTHVHTIGAMSEPRPVYDFAVEGPVQAEVFVLYLDDGQIMLTGPCGADPWLIELGPDDDPVETVTRMVRANVGEPTVVHSTSWRRDRAAVILSFVVVIGRELAAPFESVPIGRSEMARSEATAAPASIASAQVIEHGLRHLAWLVRDDEVVREELAIGWPVALDGYVPEPFRHLHI